MLYIVSRTLLYPKQRNTLSIAEESSLQEAAALNPLAKRRPGSDLLLIAPVNTVAIFIYGTTVETKQKRNTVIDVLQSMDNRASGMVFQKALAALQGLYVEYDRLSGASHPSIDWWIFLRGQGDAGLLHLWNISRF
jgi:hypothetical protein